MSISEPDLSNTNDPFIPRPQLDLSDANAEMNRIQPIIQRIPLGSPLFQRSMASVFHHLQVANRALALGCGISSEFRFLPQTWGFRELNIVHGRYLVPMSYHLYSALGAAELLSTGRGRPSHFPLVVGCMSSIVRLWQNFPSAIANLRTVLGPRYAAVVDQTEQSIRQLVAATQQALAISRSSVEPAIWDAAVRASQLAYEVRERVTKSMGEEKD
jgi:hypothetical protein